MAAPGALYGSLQPNTITPHWLTIMENERQVANAAHAKQAERMAKQRAELLEGEAKLDVQGNFLDAATRTMQDARMDKVRLYNEYNQGKMSETDFLLAKKNINDIPLLINSAYQIHEAKLAELAEGDPKMNYDYQNQLLKASSSMKIMYDPETRGVMLGFKDVDGNEHKTTISDYSNMVNAIETIPDQGDPVEKVIGFGQDFRADITQNGRLTMQGMDVGKTKQRFLDSFRAVYGDRSSGKNKLIEKYISKDNPDIDTYGEAYDMLLGLAANQMPEIFKRAPEPSTGSVPDPDKKIKSMNWNKFADSIEVTPGETISGGAYTFKASDATQKIDFDLSIIEGMPEGVAQTVKVNEVFISDDEEIYVKGTANVDNEDVLLYKSFMDESEDSEAKDILTIMYESAIKKGKKVQLPWMKVSGSGESQVISNIFEGKRKKEMMEFLGQDRAAEAQENPKDRLGLGI